jgi:hypothetical protein
MASDPREVIAAKFRHMPCTPRPGDEPPGVIADIALAALRADGQVIVDAHDLRLLLEPNDAENPMLRAVGLAYRAEATIRLRARLRAALAATEETPETDWRCKRCGSTRWGSASLTGPVEYGGTAIKQCVPCGHYSNDPVTDEDRRRRRAAASPEKE